MKGVLKDKELKSFVNIEFYTDGDSGIDMEGKRIDLVTLLVNAIVFAFRGDYGTEEISDEEIEAIVSVSLKNSLEVAGEMREAIAEDDKS